MAIHLASYRNPSKNEGIKELNGIFAGRKSNNDAILKKVKMRKYINHSLIIHFVIMGIFSRIFFL
jgi:hypothetical protein